MNFFGKTIFSLCIILSQTVDLFCCWHDLTYVLVARIACEQLDPGILPNIRDLSEDIDGEFPGGLAFDELGCWLKDRSLGGLSALNQWHFMRVSSDSLDVSQEANGNGNLCFALEEAVQTLENPRSGPWEKNFMLRVLVHCIADLHHPFHCLSLNEHNETTEPLRIRWDNMLGEGRPEWYQQGWRREWFAYDDQVELESLMAKIIYTDVRMELDSKDIEFLSWVKESHSIAVEVVASRCNFEQERRLLYRQIHRAGSHLASILNKVFRSQN